ncbi:MAG: hypothetical protein ABI442_07435, partial [Gemmatimonadaceae bacterium]
MNIVARVSLTAAVGLLGVAVALGRVGERPEDSGALLQMSEAAAFFDSTIVLARPSLPSGPRGDELAISLGYLERLRAGVGSPFRLVNEAIEDPRLGSMNSRVAWALLARLRRGDAYVVDASALDGGGPWGPDGHGATGAAHVALIERVINSASDPRAGEQAIRLAYMIESAKGTIAGSTPRIAQEVAALVRDRGLATRDLARLLADGSDERSDVLSLLTERRALHGFAVEQPGLVPLTQALEVEAAGAVPSIVRALDTLDRVEPSAVSATASTPVIGTHFAARLRALGAWRPPTPQVFVTLGGGKRVLSGATNEETLAALNAIASQQAAPDSAKRVSAIAMLDAAVAVRTLAQDEPWFPGNAGPDASDLVSEFGLAGVKFSKGVPASWQPYYLGRLQASLRDMQSVFPALSFNGLRVRFGAEVLRDSALAMHDPRNRTLDLPIFTAGGTLAHELSHDLDWQTAQHIYADGTGYSTDRAMRDRTGSLATSLRALADARPTRPYSGVAPAERPTELFARGTDWFVATALAQQGRSNGYLSAIEDGVFAGYAAGAPGALGAAGTASLLSAIGTMTYLPDSLRSRFESQWSDPSVVDATLLVRRALEAPVSWRGVPVWSNRTDLFADTPALPVCAGDRSVGAR